ncbi:PglL family O-oligosaccharyltransferase [Ralstonia pickettii]|uniref:PglL family O-oligosaccharyltransferase n=1 Tax=Ralstonia pickettii TaxID=329 RepID=UPI0015BCB44C|nr:O-antigen ligase family protein [Ralstonia pickettii]NWK43367.1 O-antigen ligase C-terminal domain-containing protein [Ralstonia pickettii]
MLRSRLLVLPLWFAIAMCGALPYLVAMHTFPLPTFFSEFVTGICWIVLAVAVLALTWNDKTGLPRAALAPFLLIGVLFVQLQFAPPLNPFLTLSATLFLLAAAIACGLGARCRNFPGVLEAFAFGIILGGLLSVAIELLQLFRVPNLPMTLFGMQPTGTGRRMWANLNQPNHLASYLAFALAACAFFASKCRRAWIPLAAISLVLLLGMALTFSRITWLHIGVVGGLAGLAWTVDQTGYRRWMWACVPILLLAVVYQLFNWLAAYANVVWHLDLPGSMGDRMQEGAGLRPLLWKHAWHMFLAHPWLGGGWGDYAWNQFVQTDTLGRVEVSFNAHNIVLDQLAKVGVLGLLAVALPLLGFAWSLRKRRMTPGLAFLLTIIVVIGGHSMLEYPLHYLFFLLPFAFALGYVDDRMMRAPSASAVWGSTALVSIGAAAMMTHLWGDYLAVQRLHYGSDGLQEELARYRAHGWTLLLPYENLAKAIHWYVIPEVAPTLVKLEQQAVEFYPGPATVQRYALALAYVGKTDEAVQQLRRMSNNYWVGNDYAIQSTLVTQACAQKQEALKAFCGRLKAERLLVEAPSHGGAKPSASSD